MPNSAEIPACAGMTEMGAGMTGARGRARGVVVDKLAQIGGDVEKK